MRMRMRVGMVLTGAQLFLMTMPMASCALLVAPNVRLPHIESSRCQPVCLAAVEPNEVTLVLDITMPQQALMACAEKVKSVSVRAAAAAGVGLKLQALCTLRRMIIVAATLLISVGLRALWVSRVGSSSSSTTTPTTITTTSTTPVSAKAQPLAKKSSAADQPAEQGSTAALASSLLSLAEVAAEGVVAAAAVALTSVSEISTPKEPKEMSLAEQRAKVLAAADAFTANDGVQGAANADPRALLLELRDVVGKQVELLEDMDSKLKSKSSEVRRLEAALEALEDSP